MKWQGDNKPWRFREQYSDEFTLIAVVLALVVLFIVGLLIAAASHTRGAALCEQTTARMSYVTEQQREELNRWRALAGAELWAHEYTDVIVVDEPIGGIDGAGREITEARTERSEAVVVYAMWRFDSRDEADDFLEHVGGLIDD